MQLIADRFALPADGDAVDLATGERAALVIEPAGTAAAQIRWSERCQTFCGLRHHAIAPLLDFGLAGSHARFEAWACGARWRGASDHARAVHERAARFLRAMALTVGAGDAADMRTNSGGGCAWLPDVGSGYPLDDGLQATDRLSLVDRGVAVIERPAISALAEMFATPEGRRPQMAALWGEPHCGMRTALEVLARQARLRGFVPVSAHLLDSMFEALWAGRSLFVLAPTTAGSPWSAFLKVSLRVSQPHVFLLAGPTECHGLDGVPLRRIAVEALVGSVRPSILGTADEPRVRRDAVAARGAPGVFLRRLWRLPLPGPDRRAAGRPRTALAAEQPAIYGADDGVSAGLEALAHRPSVSWPAPGELTALRRKLETALDLVAAGRHEPGIRELRQAIAGLARRGAADEAAAGGVHLAAALLRRGRPSDASHAVQDAQRHAVAAGAEGVLTDLAVLDGEAWIDRARLDEAERVLATAVAAARAAGDGMRLMAASISMGRCLLWRGRFAEAAAALERRPSSLLWPLECRAEQLAARIALGQRDVAAAVSHATRARACVPEGIAHPAKAAALYACALAHLAVGDLAVAESEIAATIDAAHPARDPLRALRARLLRVELERRRGRHAAAASGVARLEKAAAVTPLLRARWRLASTLCGRSDADRAAIERHIASSGLPGLELHAWTARRSGGAAASGDRFLEHVTAILNVCQTADDEAVVLKDVCLRLRQQLHAASVAFVSLRDGVSRVLAHDGPRIDGDAAGRAASAGIAIAPHRRDTGVEAAAPVVYGGSPLGALCARWTLGSTYELSGAAPVLAMTAAAAAPVVAMAIDRHDRQPLPGDVELLGVSAAIGELRRSIAAAAAAPFAVLVDGESGSGKELVARAIHRGSGRRHKPFATLNCAALPDDLVEAELFGHARGAFTGAAVDRAGVFEEAHGGTMFLDEIGELSPRAQAKLLRVIQEGELRRVGETVTRRVDVRIVAATNRDLGREVEAGRFRLDLLYRLDVVHIAVPPLRERLDDVPVLAAHFWREATARVGSRAVLGAATIAALSGHRWPGNVRELQNVLAALAVRCPKRGIVPAAALPPAFAQTPPGGTSRLDEARRGFEERFVRAALVRTGGHRGRAADQLGVTRQGLTKLMTRLGIGESEQ